MTCTIDRHDHDDTDGTEWDEMSKMMVTTKRMRVIYDETYIKSVAPHI